MGCTICRSATTSFAKHYQVPSTPFQSKYDSQNPTGAEQQILANGRPANANANGDDIPTVMNKVMIQTNHGVMYVDVEMPANQPVHSTLTSTPILVKSTHISPSNTNGTANAQTASLSSKHGTLPIGWQAGRLQVASQAQPLLSARGNGSGIPLQNGNMINHSGPASSPHAPLRLSPLGLSHGTALAQRGGVTAQLKSGAAFSYSSSVGLPQLLPDPSKIVDTVHATFEQRKQAALCLKYLRSTVFASLMKSDVLESFAYYFQLTIHPAHTTLILAGQDAENFFVVGEGIVNIEIEQMPTGKPKSSANSGQAVINALMMGGTGAASGLSIGGGLQGMGVNAGQDVFAPTKDTRKSGNLESGINSSSFDSASASTPLLSSAFSSSSAASATAAPSFPAASRVFAKSNQVAPAPSPQPAAHFKLPPLSRTNNNTAVNNKTFSLNSSAPLCSLASPVTRSLLLVKRGGEIFGEQMLAGIPFYPVCAVTASATSTILVMSREAFSGFLAAFPSLTEKLKSVGENMEETLSKMDFLREVEKDKMKLLVSLFKYVPLRRNDTLFKENDFDREHGNSLYFLYKGYVSAFTRDPNTNKDVLLCTLGPGAFFGEVSLMMDIPRTATIIANSNCILLELSQKDFRNFIVLVPEILKKFNSKLAEYNISLRYFIHNPIVLEYFIKHCKSEYSTENIEFWMAAREYRKLHDRTREELKARASEIITTYVNLNAAKQVNLNGRIQTQVLTDFKSETLTLNLFASAEEEILNLMSQDSFTRFRNSPLFSECLETVNSPWAAVLRKLFIL